MSSLVGVPAACVQDVWGEVAPLVVRCMNKVGEYRWNVDDILTMLANRDAQLWLCIGDELDGMVITEITRWPQAVDCNLFMMAGRMPEDWHDHLVTLENWARSMGCTHMSSVARPGSARIVGYTKGLVQTHRRL